MNLLFKLLVTRFLFLLLAISCFVPRAYVQAANLDLTNCSLSLELLINGKLNVNDIILRSKTDKYTLQARLSPSTSDSGCKDKIYWRITSQNRVAETSSLKTLILKSASTEKLPMQTSYALPLPTAGKYNYTFQISSDKNFSGDILPLKNIEVEFSDDQQKVLANQKVSGTNVVTKGSSGLDEIAHPANYAGKDWDGSLSILKPLKINGQEATDISQVASKLINWLLLIISLVATIMIVYAGVLLVFNGGNESQFKKAKTIITWAIIGLVVSLSAFAIVNIIQSLLG